MKRIRIILAVLLALFVLVGLVPAAPWDGTGGWDDDGTTTSTDRNVAIGGSLGWNNTNTVVMIGDSIVVQDVASDELDPYNRGIMLWTNYRLSQRINIVADLGNGGDTTTQVLARISSILNYDSQYVYVHCGINDITGAVSANTIYTNTIDIWEFIKANGRVPIGTTIPPSAGIDTAEEAQVWSEVNRKLKKYARENYVLLADLGSAIIDESDSYPVPATNTTEDSTHPSLYGALLESVVMADLLNDVMPPQPRLSSTNADTENIVSNGMMLGTSGAGLTGDVADSWRIDAFTATVVSTKVARTDSLPGEWQKSNVTADIGVTGFSLMSQTIEGVSANVGKHIYGYIELDFDDWSDPTSLLISYQFKESDGTLIAQHYVTRSDGSVHFIINPGYGVLRFQRTLIPENTDKIYLQIRFLCDDEESASILVGRVCLYIDD